VNGQLTQILALLAQQRDLLQELVDMGHGRTGVSAKTETVKEIGDPGWTYELYMPEEPPVGTVAIGRNNTTVVRKSSGWQITGEILTSPWVNVLQHLGPLRVIHQADVQAPE